MCLTSPACLSIILPVPPADLSNMSLAAFLSELTTSSGIDQAVGSDFVEQYIQSIEDLQQLNAFARAHTLLGKCLYSAASWELFDKVYALSLGGGQEISRKILSDTVTLLSEQVRPKELVLMTTEKLAGCSDTNSFAVLLFAMQLVIAGSNSAGSWEQGMQFSCYTEQSVTQLHLL